MVGKVLYVSGSVGLGHIERDMAIASEIRRLKPGTEVHWMAGDPARRVLKLKGETVLPQSETFDQGTESIQASSKDYVADLSEPAYDMVSSFDKNGKLTWGIAKQGGYDVVAHDEAYEVATVLNKNPALQCCKSAFMSDYFAYWGPTKGLKAKMVKRISNKLWLKGITKFDGSGAYMLLCEREDIPDQKLGFMMPNAQDLVGQDFVKFTGYPVTFDPKALPDKGALRKEYGLGQGPLILVTIGGTNVGKPLLELCVKAFPSIRDELHDATMVLVGGPNLDPDQLKMPEGILAKGYVPDLFRLMAACDLGICSGGSTTTLEFIALRKPFLYFPLQRHFEQQIIVAGRNERLGAGKKMQFPQTKPELLKKAVLENIGTKVELPKAGFQGVQMAGAKIAAML